MSKTEIPYEYQDAIVSPVISKLFEESPDWQSLILIGPAGTGKTTQMYALAQEWEDTNGDDWVMIISECMDISRQWKDYDILNTWICWGGVLCIDDLGYAKPTEWCRDAVYAIATERRKHGLQTVWSTNLTRDTLATEYSPAIASRLLGGIVQTTKGDDRRLQQGNDSVSVKARREEREAIEAKKQAGIEAEKAIQRMVIKFTPDLVVLMNALWKSLGNRDYNSMRLASLERMLDGDKLLETFNELIAAKTSIFSDDGQEFLKHVYRVIKTIATVTVKDVDPTPQWSDDMAAIIPEIVSGARV